MRLIACLAAMVVLSGCLGGGSAEMDSYHQRNASYAAAVDAGTMKESERYRRGIDEALQMKGRYRNKDKYLEYLNLRYKNAKAYEAGLITKDKYEDIKREALIFFDKWQQITTEQLTQDQQRRARAWAQGIQQYQNYLNSLTPRQPSQNRPPAFLKSQRTSGFNQICIYDRMGSQEAHNFKATDICPQMMQ